MENWISKYDHCANLYDIFERQAEIWYFTKSTFLNTFITSFQGRTYPLGKGRRLPWAPKSQGPPNAFHIGDAH